MDEASSRQEGRDAMKLSDELRYWGHHADISEHGKEQHLDMADRAEQLEAENNSLRQLHTAQMEESERLWAIRDSLAELLEPDEPHDLGGPHISIPWVIAKFDALKEGNPYGLIDWRKPVEGDDAD